MPFSAEGMSKFTFLKKNFILPSFSSFFFLKPTNKLCFSEISDKNIKTNFWFSFKIYHYILELVFA